MTPSLTLSVIIPTFNRAAFVRTCLGSLLECGVANIEIVVADDGSTDDTQSVALAAGPAIRYVRQANAGPAAARNLGFAVSTGRYVAFLDCDDQWIAGAPLKALEALDRHPTAAAIFADARRTRAGELLPTYLETYGRETFRALNTTNLGSGLHRMARGPLLRQLVRRNVIFLGSLILRREVFSSLGGFDPNLRGAADWELILRLASEYELLFCANTPLAVYVLHPEGMSNDGDHMAEEFIRALEGLLDKGRLDVEERRFVKDALAHHRFVFAYDAYDRGVLDVARQRFAACLRQAPTSSRALAYYLASHLPSTLVRIGRTLKQRALS